MAIAVTLAALVVRDAYVYPKRRSPHHASVDASVALLFLVLFEMFLTVFVPDLALPGPVLLRAVAVGLLAVSMVRMIFGRSPGTAGPAQQSYKMTRAITVLWMVAAVILVMTNPEFVPALIPHQDFWLVFLPIVFFGTAFRLQKNVLDRTARKDGITSLFDSHRNELTRKRDALWAPAETKRPEFPWHTAIEILAMALFGLPLCIVLLSWLSGHTPSSEVDWMTVGTNLGAFLSLSVSWIHIRKANQKAARALQEQIDELSSSKKKT